MNYKVDKKLMRNLAKTADIVNTVGGGTVFPSFDTQKEVDHYRMEVSVPSVNQGDIKVEVNGEFLFVYQLMEYKGSRIPNMLGVHKIPTDVVINNISASYEEDLLVIIMPFSELAGGFRKEIDILRN